MKKGILFAAGAYGLWGFLPIYWKLLDDVPAIEILSHRMVWGFVFCVALLAVTRSGSRLRQTVRDRRTLLLVLAAALLLTINWFTYIWGVNNGFIIETSLGYFINPLVNVLLGVILFRETLRAGQWFAVALAAAGVLYLTVVYGSLPWIALTLAVSFAFYGVLKKTVKLPSLEGLSLETGLLFLFAAGFLLWRGANGTGSFGQIGWVSSLLLIGTGVVTAVPLLFFAAAAQRIPLSLLGLMQYLAPTFQFLIGVFLYNEPFSQQQLVGFCLIWAALALYTSENIWTQRRRRATPAPTVP